MVGSNAFSRRLETLDPASALRRLPPLSFRLDVDRLDQAGPGAARHPAQSFRHRATDARSLRFLPAANRLPTLDQDTLIVTAGPRPVSASSSVTRWHDFVSRRQHPRHQHLPSLSRATGPLFIPLSQIVARSVLQQLLVAEPHLPDLPYSLRIVATHWATSAPSPRTRGRGARRWSYPLQAMTRIVLPLAIPGVLSAGAFCFTLG